MPAVAFEKVDIIFGTNFDAAFKLIDQGARREEVIAATDCVPGAVDINFAVERGEICVLMGLSGSGKSTVLRAINHLNTVARGTVTVEHEGKTIDVRRCDDRTLRELRTRAVAMVFQQFALLPWRTIRETVGFGLEVRGTPAAERRRIVDEKLALVGLSNWSEKYSDELSGGMQQRVGLARAFATDAPILLMDEPFSALDPLIRDKLQDELLDLQQKLKKTIVFVSHDLDEALKIGNRIAILEGGRIVQMGTAKDILLRPADDYVAEFVKHMNPLNVLRGRHDHDALQKILPADGSVRFYPVTTAWGVLVVAGPRSRELLERVTDTDLSSAVFPWLSGKPVNIGPAEAHALRVNFVGEMGWELHHPIEMQNTIFDLLWEAGEDLGLRPFGIRAMMAMALEKSYRLIGRELSIEYAALESGLDRFVHLNKGDFLGREALTRWRERGFAYRFVTMEVHDVVDADARGSEPILVADRMIGRCTWGGYGWRTGKSLALGMVRPEFGKIGQELAVVILGKEYRATVIPESPYDPDNTRLKA